MAAPQTRTKARARALEFLYGLDFTKDDCAEALARFWDTFETKATVRDYAEVLVKGVTDNRSDLDAQIDQALTTWRPDRVGIVERNILRIALFELRYGNDVPTKVVINEAIELAKSYAADESPGFINAVLDRLKDSDLRETTT